MYHRDDQFDSYAHTSSTWVKIGDFHVDFTISEYGEIKKFSFEWRTELSKESDGIC